MRYEKRINLQRARRQTVKLKEMQQLREDEETATALALVHRGPGKRFFTVAGAFKLASQRVMSNAAAATFGISQCLDVTGSSLARWEVSLRAALIVPFRKFHQQCRREIVLN
eukprot:2950685-Pyramimonas_sp.AAC.1